MNSLVNNIHWKTMKVRDEESSRFFHDLGLTFCSDGEIREIIVDTRCGPVRFVGDYGSLKVYVVDGERTMMRAYRMTFTEFDGSSAIIWDHDREAIEEARSRLVAVSAIESDKVTIEEDLIPISHYNLIAQAQHMLAFNLPGKPGMDTSEIDGVFAPHQGEA